MPGWAYPSRFLHSWERTHGLDPVPYGQGRRRGLQGYVCRAQVAAEHKNSFVVKESETDWGRQSWVSQSKQRGGRRGQVQAWRRHLEAGVWETNKTYLPP